MPVAIGLYLPFGLSVTIFAGALIHAMFGAEAADESGPGILLAAGLVAGEALMGVASGALVTAGIIYRFFDLTRSRAGEYCEYAISRRIRTFVY